ncbi:cytochrome c-type protein NapC [Desulfatibacillum alkenivorans DSM 16219]|jgi:cytochrome c-type protein NapC/trimethylamine-N-oxide reductase cytochrome c-type subunit TorC|uniref:Cytochrome c-type protein n=1 Tax=Desulfatibacillum alkenivorans DSM 16219 TaxID=1121393 RepID=A0A1M7A1L8_9BACT|nr:NapC/NirT family cytochrome c [Desulfatibacillum alkenivorans]SHL36652.1 cytochrome c-type protein NapC [Desulfatibacillum alkenivorans DSM 16219]
MLKKLTKPMLIIALGLVLGFPLFSLTYYAMVRTSTPQFCASCHEIRPAYNDWKTSSHVNNAQGFVADCMDCHLPAPHDTWNFFYAKTAHGIKDVAAHVMGNEYDRQEQRENAYAAFKNSQCQKCHRNILYIPDKRGAMLAHRSVLYPRPGYEKRCVDCHRNLVHVPREIYAYKQYQPPYRGQGL